MKILVITPHRYGIREVAERVGQEWEQQGHDVEYELAKGEAARIGPVTVGVPGIAWWWYRQFDRLEGSDYDFIWAHQPIVPTLPTKAASLWNRVVVTFHTTLRAEYDLAREGIYPAHLLPFYWLTKSLEARTYRQLEALDADGPHYTIISPHLREEIGTFGVTDAVEIPNGIFTPDEETFAPIRSEYGIPEDATVVFNIGSHTPQKRPVEFARLLRGVTDRDGDIYGVLAGKGPLHEDVQAYTSDRVLAPGYVSDEAKWRWFADADVFASFAAYEGMPVATLEALSFGVPVVLSDIPAHRNVVDQYTDIGALVEEDPDDLLAAIQQVKGTRPSVTLPSWTEIAEAYFARLPVGGETQASVPRGRASEQ